MFKLANVVVVFINHNTKCCSQLKADEKVFAGEFDVKVSYFSDNSIVNILKTKLKE